MSFRHRPFLPIELEYSDKYYDDHFEYRHVVLPKEKAKNVLPERLLSEKEWRRYGITQSHGWKHFMIYAPGI